MMKKQNKKPFNVSLIYVIAFSIILSLSMSVSVFAADLLQEFGMDQVSITDSYYVNAFNKMVAYLQALDPNRLLVGFKQTAGISTSYSLYGGWENSLIQGHTMGHYMVALAQAYKNTNNSDLRSRIDLIISELQACQNRNGNGYLFATPVTQFDVVEGKVSGNSWVPWYTMHKIVTGLVEINRLTGNSTALSVANNLGNWIYNRANSWDSATQSRVLGVEYGGMNDCLYDLYKLSGNNNHLTAAHKFDETSFFNIIAAGTNNLNGKHANTQIPKFVGACNRYRVLGSSENSYRTAAEQFWTIVLRDCTYITGGNSQNECFRPAGQLNAYRDHLNNETCNSYNMLKLTRGLFLVTGDVKYADYYERAYINEIIASQNPDSGMTTYFKPMGTGFFKVFSSQFNHFWCCTGTGMENFTKLNDSLYFNNGSDLYVNMYLSSTLNWSARGLSLTQQANIPSSDTVNFTINSAPSTAVRIKFRTPYWIASGRSINVRVNGSDFSATNAGGYVDVNRTWASGDTIQLSIPLEVQVSRCTDNQNVVAFTYGPIILSAGLGTASMTTASHGVNVTVATKNVTVRETINIYSSVSSSVNDWLNNIRTNLVQTPGTLEFTLKNTDADNELVFIPHYKRYTDRYGIYFNLAMSAGGPTAEPTVTPTPDSSPVPTGTPNQEPIFSGGPYTLDGASTYIDLPDGLTNDLYDFSIACRVNLNSLDTWTRVYDFGGDTNIFMMLTPASGNTGYPYFCITLTGNAGEQGLNGNSAMPTGSWQHIAVTRNGSTAILYINGQEVNRNTGMTLNPADMGNTVNNFVGRSQWSHDPYLNGAVDEFYVYNRALSVAEVVALADSQEITPEPTETPTPTPTPTPTATPPPGDCNVSFDPETSTQGLNSAFAVNVVVDSGTQELAAYGFTISYNANVLSVENVEAGADGFLAAANTDNPGEIVASGFDTAGKGPGSDLQVLIITFNAIAEGTSSLGMYVDRLIDGDTNTIGTACGNDGSVEVTDALLGDTNGDGAIDIVDALLTAQYYVGLDPSGFIPGNADTNCDGNIDIVDALLIAQYYVGLITSFC